MNIYFSGIGGSGIAPLAQLALDAGYKVFGSDQNLESPIIMDLIKRGVIVSEDQSGEFLETIKKEYGIDWMVYTSALPTTHPELVKADELGIKFTKRDKFIPEFIKKHNFTLLAVAGTHGKTTTTTMLIWLFKNLGISISYLVGSTLPFGPAGKFENSSRYFIYECDEYDKNFLQYYPDISIVPAIDHDHIDIYPTLDSYQTAFKQFFKQSKKAYLWQKDFVDKFAGLDNLNILYNTNNNINLLGHNKQNASLIIEMLRNDFPEISIDKATEILNSVPQPGRRFEKIKENLISDYAHHPKEVESTINMAKEYLQKYNFNKLVIVYQPHHNGRQEEFQNAYDRAFKNADKVYWLPTYLARVKEGEKILTAKYLSRNVKNVTISNMDDNLKNNIQNELNENNLVVIMSAGPLDSWLRKNFSN